MTIKHRSWTPEEMNVLKQMAGKHSPEEIAKKVNRSLGSVRSQAGKWGISLARITEDAHDIWLCQELFKEGLTVPVIAKKMEMRCAAVYRIVFNTH